MRRLSFFIFLLLLLVPSAVLAQTRIVHSDFEEGASWDWSDDGWTAGREGEQESEWTITTTCGPAGDTLAPGGSYCAQSESPSLPINELAWNNDSIFHATLPTTGVNEIFIRFKYRPDTDMSDFWKQWMRIYPTVGGDIEVGNSGGGCGTHLCWPTPQCDACNCTAGIRFNQGAGNTIIRNSDGSLADGDPQWNHDGVVWRSYDPYHSPGWHEYAIYFNYSENKLWYWYDAVEYTSSDPGWGMTTVVWGSYKADAILMPMYVKDHALVSCGPEYEGTDWTFWVDDIEIYRDGIPTARYGSFK